MFVTHPATLLNRSYLRLLVLSRAFSSSCSCCRLHSHMPAPSLPTCHYKTRAIINLAWHQSESSALHSASSSCKSASPQLRGVQALTCQAAKSAFMVSASRMSARSRSSNWLTSHRTKALKTQLAEDHDYIYRHFISQKTYLSKKLNPMCFV